MKLIKTMLAGMVLLVFAAGQEQTDGGPPPPPPCDPNAAYPVADPGPDGGCGNYNDCNGNGAYDLGEPCGDPVPFEDVDTNADGVVDREEGRAQYGYDPNFDQQFDEADTNGDGVVDHPEYDAAVQGYDEAMQGGGPGDHDDGDHDGGPTFEDVDTNGDGVIDREEARAVFGYDDEGNADPEFDTGYDGVDQNGDGVVDPAEFEAAGDDQGPDGPGDGDTYWADEAYQLQGQQEHYDRVMGVAEEDREHEYKMIKDELGIDDGGDHDGDHSMGPAPTNHWDGNCGAMMNGEDEYWLDSDGDGSPEDGPYAVWHEDADGNPVDCGPGPGDHDGGDHDDGPRFEDVDANGDGVVDREEARAFFGDELGEDFDAEYDIADANGDGVVDHDEFNAAGDGGGDYDGGDHDGGDHDGGDHDGGPRFEDVDANGDGVVDREEARAFFGDELGEDFDAEYDIADANGDGVVDPAEFEAAGDDQGPDGPKFEDVDTNGDGVIDREEARAVFGYDDQGNPDPEFDTGFDDVDQNGDGVVDPAEYEAAGDDENNN